MIKIKVKRLENGDGIDTPFYATDGSAGADVAAAIGGNRVLSKGERALIPTGFALEFPPGYELQIRPRSGLALNHGLTILNTPATIDNDYRGEVKVLLCNFGDQPFTIERGMRIAQLVIAPIVQGIWQEVEELAPTYSDRTEEGFGSTGLQDKI